MVAIYWLVIAITSWLPDRVKQSLIQLEIIIGVMLIIDNYILLGQPPYLELVPLQIGLLWLTWWANRTVTQK